MNTDKKHHSFGRYLASARLEKGISLKDVSSATRIGAEMLCLIENEDHSLLPAEVFVKGFVRAYARAVGVDGERVVGLYVESREAFRATTDFEKVLLRQRKNFWLPVLLVLGSLLCLMAVSVYGEYVLTRQSADHSPTVQPAPASLETHRRLSEFDRTPKAAEAATEKEAGGPVGIVPQPIAAPADGAMPTGDVSETRPPDVPEATEPEDAAEQLSLHIVAVEKTWLKVIADAEDPREFSLKPGQRLELEAASGFNLLIGNAAGIRLFLNGNPVGVSGKRGQVVTLQLP